MSCQIDANLQLVSDVVIVVGVILLSITISISNTSGGMWGHIFGYSFLAAGFIFKAVSLGMLLGKSIGNADKPRFIGLSIMPFVTVAGIISYILFILTFYFNRIVGGKVTKSYRLFSNMFIAVVIAQLMLFYNGTKDEKFKGTCMMSSAYGMVIYLLALISLVIAITIHIILAFFTTDG